jgi:hypothetical protein
MGRELVQEIAIVAYQEADAPIHAQRAQNHPSSVRVEVIRGLIDCKQVRAEPQARRNLDSLALSVGEDVPTGKPIVPDPKKPPHPEGLPVAGGQERG